MIASSVTVPDPCTFNIPLLHHIKTISSIQRRSTVSHAGPTSRLLERLWWPPLALLDGGAWWLTLHGAIVRRICSTHKAPTTIAPAFLVCAQQALLFKVLHKFCQGLRTGSIPTALVKSRHHKLFKRLEMTVRHCPYLKLKKHRTHKN